jgi:two-component system, chemotaxis family, response regulator WspF
MPLQIAMVHHDLMARNILRKVIAAAPDYVLAWEAAGGREVIERCRTSRPDLLLVDLSLPDMDGAKVVCEIMKNIPCAILLLADRPENQAGKVFEAMGCGALDAVKTPCAHENGLLTGDGHLLKKIAILSKILHKRDHPAHPAAKGNHFPGQKTKLVAFGSSTGGPKALATIFSALPPDIPAALVVVQHVDIQFASGLSDWLNSQTRIPVRLAEEGMKPLPGVILLAGTNDHLVLGEDLTFHYSIHPRDYPYRPSVNVFLDSVNQHWPSKDLAVLLTGMGRDGGAGMAAVKKSGWHTITQDEKTSIVYGMPAAAVEMGGSSESLPLEEIAGAILKKLAQTDVAKK